jgi:hypothetical protein
MIEHNGIKNQLPDGVNLAFNELKVLQHLRTAGFQKHFGYSCSYLFQIVFTLIFHHQNWFGLLESNKNDLLPGKDAVYRFLNHPGYAWRRFLLLLSTYTIQKVRSFTSIKRVTAFVIDDSMFERNRSKKVELLARFKDHAQNCYYKGFRMLTLGWTDGNTFMPIDFSLLSSLKAQINGAFPIDKRTLGSKRRSESQKPAPKLIPEMIERALSFGISVPYVLMDSWFTYAPLIQSIRAKGLDVIGMVKNTGQRYCVNQRRLSLQELYAAAFPIIGHKGILRSIRTELVPNIPVLVVFVRHRTRKNEWLAILSTDCSLTAEEIIRIYGMRWDIETFFKCTKSLLRLQKEFQGRSYDLLISHTTIVFSRYILLSWQRRCNTDQRTFGGMFAQICDEVGELDWAVALRQLFDLISDIATKTTKKLAYIIKSQLEQWIVGLPNYIKAYLPISCCES